MNIITTITLLLLLSVLPSCGLYRALEGAAEKVDKALAQIDAGIDKYQKAVEKADTNQDGMVDRDEWSNYLLGLLGLGNLGGAAWIVRRNAASAVLKTEMQKDIEALKSKVT